VLCAPPVARFNKGNALRHDALNRRAMQAGSEVSNFEQIHDRNTGREWAMPVGYRYVIYSGDSVEALGAMPLKDDDEARLFGVGVIRDLMENAAARYAAYTMDIIQGERAVASIPFGFGEVERGPRQQVVRSRAATIS